VKSGLLDYKYVITYRIEMLSKSLRLNENFTPIRSKYVFDLSEALYTNTLRGLKLLHHFWSPWAYIETISLSAVDENILKMCNGINSIRTISRKAKVPPEELTGLIRFYMANDIVVPPEGINLMPMI